MDGEYMFHTALEPSKREGSFPRMDIQYVDAQMNMDMVDLLQLLLIELLEFVIREDVCHWCHTSDRFQPYQVLISDICLSRRRLSFVLLFR